MSRPPLRILVDRSNRIPPGALRSKPFSPEKFPCHRQDIVELGDELVGVQVEELSKSSQVAVALVSNFIKLGRIHGVPGAILVVEAENPES